MGWTPLGTIKWHPSSLGHLYSPMLILVLVQVLVYICCPGAFLIGLCFFLPRTANTEVSDLLRGTQVWNFHMLKMSVLECGTLWVNLDYGLLQFKVQLHIVQWTFVSALCVLSTKAFITWYTFNKNFETNGKELNRISYKMRSRWDTQCYMYSEFNLTGIWEIPRVICILLIFNTLIAWISSPLHMYVCL